MLPIIFYSMSKIKIIAITLENGVSYHRVKKPMMKLIDLYPSEFEVYYADSKRYDISHLPSLTEYKFDIIYFNTILGIKEDNPLIHYLEACLYHGAKIVLDIDDYFEFGRSVIVPKRVGEKHAEIVPEAIKEADVVITTTEPFAKIIEPLNSNVYVLPNFADSSDIQYNVNKTPSINSKGDKIIRIGVTGSVMHKYDIQLLQNVSYLLKRDGLLSRVQFVLCGFADSKYHVAYEKVITSDYRIVSRKYRHALEDTKTIDMSCGDEPYRRIGWRDVNSYMSIYNELDVLLAPLENTKFNTAKSEIKYIEAGWMETLFIGSDVPTYHHAVTDGVNGFLCKDTTDFYKKIKYVIENWDKTNGFIDIINKAKQDVIENYESLNITKKRAELLKSIVV